MLQMYSAASDLMHTVYLATMSYLQH